MISLVSKALNELVEYVAKTVPFSLDLLKLLPRRDVQNPDPSMRLETDAGDLL